MLVAAISSSRRIGIEIESRSTCEQMAMSKVPDVHSCKRCVQIQRRLVDGDPVELSELLQFSQRTIAETPQGSTPRRRCSAEVRIKPSRACTRMCVSRFSGPTGTGGQNIALQGNPCLSCCRQRLAQAMTEGGFRAIGLLSSGAATPAAEMLPGSKTCAFDFRFTSSLKTILARIRPQTSASGTNAPKAPCAYKSASAAAARERTAWISPNRMP